MANRTKRQKIRGILPVNSLYIKTSNYLIYLLMKMASQRFTDQLRLAAGHQWERVVNHKFTRELAAGTLNRDGELME